jgi:hypothetical protein
VSGSVTAGSIGRDQLANESLHCRLVFWAGRDIGLSEEGVVGLTHRRAWCAFVRLQDRLLTRRVCDHTALGRPVIFVVLGDAHQDPFAPELFDDLVKPKRAVINQHCALGRTSQIPSAITRSHRTLHPGAHRSP